MKERQFLQLPLSAWEVIEELDDVQKGQLLSAAFQYDMKGSLPDFNGVLKVAFIVIRQYLDLCSEHYEETCKRNSENGKKGGRPKKNAENVQNSAVSEEVQSDVYTDEDVKVNDENESSEKRAVFFETEKSQNKINKNKLNKNKLNYIKVSEKESKEKETAAFDESGNDTDQQTDQQTTKTNNVSFGKSVKLTEEQYAELCGEYGSSVVDEYIFKVDGYIDEKGCRPYGNQFSTIKRWIEEDRRKLAEKESAEYGGNVAGLSGHSYDLHKMLDYAMTHIPTVKN